MSDITEQTAPQADASTDSFVPAEEPEVVVDKDEDRKKLISELFPDEDINNKDEVIDNLTEGLKSRFIPSLTKTQDKLKELTENQRILIETLLQENSKFSDSEALANVKATMDKGKQYQEKLLRIKKEMLYLHEKSAKLKKRAIALQQLRTKQDLQEEHAKELQEARERQLIAKPVTSKTSAKDTAK